jgi:hypothetical protein
MPVWAHQSILRSKLDSCIRGDDRMHGFRYS